LHESEGDTKNCQCSFQGQGMDLRGQATGPKAIKFGLEGKVWC